MKETKGGFRVKIQEMEQRTGIPKKNIRFYEKEGLLAPARAGNQYREYTEEEAETLLHIKLLRRLGLPLEEIRLIQLGHISLQNGMRWQAEKLSEEMRHLHNTRTLCRRIGEEGRGLDSLKTTEILAEMDEMEAKGERFATVVKEVTGRVKRFLPPKPVHVIEPTDSIVNGADVDAALIEYAAKHGYDLTILRPGSYSPKVILDGRELWGMVLHTRFGPWLSLYAKEEESMYGAMGNSSKRSAFNLFKKHKD